MFLFIITLTKIGKNKLKFQSSIITEVGEKKSNLPENKGERHKIPKRTNKRINPGNQGFNYEAFQKELLETKMRKAY